MALTDRVKIILGNILQVTNCDGTTVETPIDCGCEPETGNPGTTPPPVALNRCQTANWYAFAMDYYLYALKDNLSGQPDNFFGRHVAIANTAFNLQLPASPWVWFVNGFIGADNPTAAENRANLAIPDPTLQETHDILVCIIMDILEQNGDIFTYEPLKTRMEAQGWYAWGEIVAAIPLALFLEQTYNLSVELPPLTTLAGVSASDCADCDDVPTPVDCPDACEETVCNLLRPTGVTNPFIVTGYDSIAPFVSTSAAMWYGKDFNPLRIDMLENKCVSEISIRPYTPCSAGGGFRSAHYRIEIDDTNVSEFKCAAAGTASYYACGENQGLGEVIYFTFDTPLYGRRINIVPLRSDLNIVQVSIKTCV